MTTSQDPDEIRREIDMTRGRLSEDVDVLTESVRPSSVARRTGQRATSKVAGLRDHVMGTAHHAADAGSEQLHGAADTVRSAPQAARRQARGNPLAAGAVALAAGWLVGSLLPAAEKERTLVEEAKSVAQESAQNLKEPAQEAVQSVKETAAESAQHVKEEGASRAQDVKDQATSGSSGSSGGQGGSGSTF